MCGIACFLNTNENQFTTEITELIETNLKRRGPDSFNHVIVPINLSWNGMFLSSVLHTQGKKLTKQPLVFANSNMLLWNGDIFGGNLLNENVDSISDTATLGIWLDKNDGDILQAVTKIEGPYSFIYFNQKEKYLWVGRDPLGRHSLLWKITPNNIMISSVGHKKIDDFTEIPAVGIFCFQFNDTHLTDIYLHRWSHCTTTYDFSEIKSLEKIKISDFIINYFNFNHSWLNTNVFNEQFYLYKNAPTNNGLEIMNYFLNDPKITLCVDIFLKLLTESIRKRVTVKQDTCINCTDDIHCLNDHGKIAVLFSGGLDSTIIAYLADKFVNKDEPIDLLNVAFECQDHFNTPDRKTALLSFNELSSLKRNRKWNLVEINITEKELDYSRHNHIRHLIYPLNSILDESLGCALWFACRGIGYVSNIQYKSPAKILLIGIGADEQLGGYMRHRNLLKRKNWQELGKQLSQEIIGISKRNLGRDDRVASDNGKQPRFPFLDESLVKYVSSLPPWQRCDPVSFEPGIGDKLILRLAAVKLGLKQCAVFPKRAFQFGCRIAKSKENGSNYSERL